MSDLPIHRAARDGNIKRLQAELGKGVIIDVGDAVDRTPLYRAALNGQLEAVKFLVEHKATVDKPDRNGQTPLWRACAKLNGDEIAAILLDAKADINKQSRKGITPLMSAVRKGHKHCVKLLLERKANAASVEKLDISSPKFSEARIPEWIIGATALTELDRISGAKFSEVPECLASATALTELDISYNLITRLPFWLGRLPKLRTLKATGNPLTGEQLVALNKESGFFAQPGALLSYLRTSEERVPQRHLLLTVLGHFMVGKTAVLNALAGKKAPKPEERTVQVTTDVLQDKESGISFNVRELPGQAQFYGGNRRFIGLQSTVFVVTCSLVGMDEKTRNSRTSEEQLKSAEEQFRLWLSLLNSHMHPHSTDAKEQPQGVRTVLIATHLDIYLKRNPKSTNQQLSADWALPLALQLQRDYPAVGVQSTGILLLDATQQSDARKAVMSEVRSLARGLLHERTIPKWMNDVHESWQRGRKKRPPWLTYEQAITATNSNERSIGEFALSVLGDFGDVIRIGRNIVICDPSWLSRTIASLVLPARQPFNGIPEGKGKGCMDNGVASAETLCEFLRARGVTATRTSSDKADTKDSNSDKFEQELLLLEWLEALDVLFPLRVSAGAQKPTELQQLYLVPARLNNPRLPALIVEEKQHDVARRFTLPKVERFAPGLIAHLACHLWPLDVQLSPAQFAQLEMLLVFENSQALVSLNDEHSELTVVMLGPKLALAVDAPLVLEAVKDGICWLMPDCAELEWKSLCSSCLRAGLGHAHMVDESCVDKEKGTFVCERTRKLMEVESLQIPALPTPRVLPAVSPESIESWSVARVHEFILARKPAYANTLRRQGQALDGRAMLALKSADDVYDTLGVELKGRREAIFGMARELQAAQAAWKEKLAERKHEQLIDGQQQLQSGQQRLQSGQQQLQSDVSTANRKLDGVDAKVEHLDANRVDDVAAKRGLNEFSKLFDQRSVDGSSASAVRNEVTTRFQNCLLQSGDVSRTVADKADSKRA